MKILHLITGLKVGGAETVLYNLLLGSDRTKDHHMVACFYKGPNVDKIRSLGISVRHIRGIFSAYDPVGIVQLIVFIWKQRPDVIHSSLWSANILARCVGFVFRIPVVCALHCMPEHLGFVRASIEDMTFRAAKVVVAVAPSVKNAFCAEMKSAGKNPQKIEVVYNSVDIESLQTFAKNNPLSREQFKLGQYDFVFGGVGRLVEVKNFENLIEALAMVLPTVPTARVIIVGEGPEKEKLIDIAKQLRISEYVTFTGYVPNPAPYYALFNCFVLPSYSEGLSMALLEACAFGLPIVTTTIRNRPHDIIEQGINGFVVDPVYTDDLAASMIKIFRSETLQEIMKKENLKLAKKYFSVKSMAEQYDAIFHRFDKTSPRLML